MQFHKDKKEYKEKGVDKKPLVKAKNEKVKALLNDSEYALYQQKVKEHKEARKEKKKNKQEKLEKFADELSLTGDKREEFINIHEQFHKDKKQYNEKGANK